MVSFCHVPWEFENCRAGWYRYIWRSYLSLGDTDTKRLTVVISLSLLLLLSLVATGNTTPKRGITTPEVYNPKTGKWKLLTGAYSTLYHQGSAWWYPRSYSASGNTVILFPSFQNDIWRLDPRGDGSLTKVATVPGPVFNKQAPATMFDRHKILAIQGAQEALPMKRLASFVNSVSGPILVPYQMARFLLSAVRVSVNSLIQLSSMLRFGILLPGSGASLLKLSKLDCTI